jgi:chitinase
MPEPRWKTWLGMCFVALIGLSACGAPSLAAPAPTFLPETPPPLATPASTPTVALPSTPTPRPAPTGTATPAPDATLSIKQMRSRIVGYYPAWSNPGRDGPAGDLPGNLLTHIIYAFSNIDPKTNTCVYGAESVDKFHLKNLRQLKQKYPHLKVLMAIGGATLSKAFSDMAAKTETRQKFVKSCLELYVGTYPDVIDGFDMDWEFPGVGEGTRKEDKQNFTLLMKEFRRQLDELGKQKNRSYLLTAAVPAGPGMYDLFELKELSPVLDWFNLMTYDFHGVWSKAANFTAPLYRAKDDPYPANNVDAAVRAYLKAGVPPHKITLGLPFYGRGWTTASADNQGLYQKLVKGNVSGTAFTYRNLVDNYIGKNHYLRYWDYGAKVPWLYNSADRVFITYEDPMSIGYKAEYITEHYLGGAMIWHLTSDDDGLLLQALYDRLAQ